MPAVDIVDDTFLAASPRAVAALLRDASSWRKYWPDLLLSVYTDRGVAGVRWTVTGALVGTMEVWLEPVLDGTVLHYYLRADRPGPRGRSAPMSCRAAARETRRRRFAAKDVAFGLKRVLERGRAAGTAPSAPSAP